MWAKFSKSSFSRNASVKRKTTIMAATEELHNPNIGCTQHLVSHIEIKQSKPTNSEGCHVLLFGRKAISSGQCFFSIKMCDNHKNPVAEI